LTRKPTIGSGKIAGLAGSLAVIFAASGFLVFVLYFPFSCSWRKPMSALYESTIKSLPLLGRGKVRENYAVGADKMLMVTSDRLSAFDVIMNEPIPDKGRVLNAMAQFWFAHLQDIVPNHLTGIAPETVVAADEAWQVKGRAMVVKRLKPLPVEAVVRGYIIGSGWKDYQETGAVCGIKLAAGLQMAQQLPEPIFTPATKAEMGDHDENISFEQMCAIIGEARAQEVRQVALALYNKARTYAATRGIIIADTKFEFGLDEGGQLHLMDEVLTADSSRFWPAASYQVGISPPSYDKQFVRDYLETVRGWGKKPPAPPLPADVITKTGLKYREALVALTGKDLGAL
jgi:phosphoribosylaminoimidazole-succinocarboxamide synthase